MRKTLSVAVLVLAFCCPVSAGIIHNPAPAPQPTSPVQQPAEDPTPDGEMPNPGEMQTGVSGSLAGIALDLLTVLPSLL